MHKSLHTKSVPRKSHALQDLCITTICIMRMSTVVPMGPSHRSSHQVGYGVTVNIAASQSHKNHFVVAARGSIPHTRIQAKDFSGWYYTGGGHDLG